MVDDGVHVCESLPLVSVWVLNPEFVLSRITTDRVVFRSDGDTSSFEPGLRFDHRVRCLDLNPVMGASAQAGRAARR